MVILIGALYVCVPAVLLALAALFSAFCTFVPTEPSDAPTQHVDTFVRALRDMHALRAVHYARAAQQCAACGVSYGELLRQAWREHAMAVHYNLHLQRTA